MNLQFFTIFKGPPVAMGYRPVGPSGMVRPRIGMPGQPPSFRPPIGGIVARPPGF